MFKALQQYIRSLGVVMLLGSSVLAPSGAIAEQNPGITESALVVAGGGISLQQAAGKARKQHGGKVIKAETVSQGGRKVHQIRLVKDGRVSTVNIDAASGGEISR
ncbi:MAG: PepSY domain-containing protein [Amphritea sp.]